MLEPCPHRSSQGRAAVAKEREIRREFGEVDANHVTIVEIRGNSVDDTAGVHITNADETHLLPDRHVLDRIIWAVLGEKG